MRKSLSVDNHLGSLSYAVHPAESKAERVRTKLRRQFVSIAPAASQKHTHLGETFLCPALVKPHKERLLQGGGAGGGGSSTLPSQWRWSRAPLLGGPGPRGAPTGAQLGEVWDEGLDSGHCCPEHGTRLKVGNEFSCPQLHVCEELHLPKGLPGASSEGPRQIRASTESLGQLRPSWPLGAPGVRTAGMRQDCTAAVGASDQCLMGSAPSLSHRHPTPGLGCPSPPPNPLGVVMRAQVSR